MPPGWESRSRAKVAGGVGQVGLPSCTHAPSNPVSVGLSADCVQGQFSVVSKCTDMLPNLLKERRCCT